jgi:predicted  nucleic acid-binding Zn-ribbon protein
MVDDTQHRLKQLQEIDRKIAEGEDQVGAFDPQLAEVDEPALQLEQEVTTTRARLREMKVDERRIELSADEKRLRTQKLQERLTGVRNVREEAAVSAEIQMLKRAMEGEEQEALMLLDQIRRMEARLDEQEKALEQARAELEPRQAELFAAREQRRQALTALRDERLALTASMEQTHVRVYEGIRGGRRRQAVSDLTLDGACGNCFSMIPPQRQNEVRTTGSMVRCEACGVILTVEPQDP